MQFIKFLVTLYIFVTYVSADPTCRILAMSGGGSLGAIESGVVSNLVHNYNRTWDYLTGVSAGGLNAGWISTFPIGAEVAAADSLKDIWENLHTSDVYSIQLLWTKSIFSTDPLKKWLKNKISGRKVQRPVLIGTSSYATGASYRFSEQDVTTEDEMMTAMLATSAIPVLFPPVVINNTLFGDGGLINNEIVSEGIKRCPEDSPVEVDLILCVPYLSNKNNTKDWGIIDIAIRTLEIAFDNTMNHALDNKCAPGVTSNVKINLWQANLLEDIAALDFDFGEALWETGNKLKMKESFYLC